MAGIGLLQVCHARLAGKARMELAGADIDGHHMARAACEQHLREAAGRGADIEALGARHRDLRPEIERMGELQPGARDPGMGRLGEDLGVRVERLGRTAHRLAIGADPAGLDGCARRRPALEMAEFDEELVCARKCHLPAFETNRGVARLFVSGPKRTQEQSPC